MLLSDGESWCFERKYWGEIPLFEVSPKVSLDETSTQFPEFHVFLAIHYFNTKSAIHISIICIEVPALKAAGAS
jgi:hypothetical protein